MVAATIPEHASVPPAISPSRFALMTLINHSRETLRAGQARVVSRCRLVGQAAAAGWRAVTSTC
jgi:hypothetical protein